MWTCYWLSPVWLFATSWTVAHQALLSMKLPRQEYWNGLTFPAPGALSYPGIEPRSSALQANSLPSESSGKPYYNGAGVLQRFLVEIKGLHFPFGLKQYRTEIAAQKQRQEPEVIAGKEAAWSSQISLQGSELPQDVEYGFEPSSLSRLTFS